MKLTKIFVASIIAVLLLPFISCKKKYPEGPRVSIYTPAHRLAGKWKFEQILVNNKDVTTVVLDTITYSYISIRKNEEYYNGIYFSNFVIVDTTNTLDSWTYVWYFVYNNEGEEYAIDLSPHPLKDSYYYLKPKKSFFAPLPTLISLSERWEFLKLKYKSVWLNHTDSLNNTYEVHLKRI